MTASLNVLSLFSGIGGLELGLERAGMTVVGQVEIDDYCRRVLAKHWPNVPRHDDVRTAADWWLNSTCHWCEGTGYANPVVGDCFCRREARRGWPGRHEGLEWRPQVDVLCGGFPCQDISSAGRRAGIIDGERSGLWSFMAETIRRIRPRYVLVENVPRVLVRGRDGVIPAEVVAADLAEIGYDLRWDCVPAVAVGAHHRRDRWFCIAHSNRNSLWAPAVTEPRSGGTPVVTDDGRPRPLADPNRPRLEGARLRRTIAERSPRTGELAHSDGKRLEGRRLPTRPGHRASDPDRRGPLVEWRRPQTSSQWSTEPDVGRVAHGVPTRLDRAAENARLRGLGNAVVPQVAEYVGRVIIEHASAAS